MPYDAEQVSVSKYTRDRQPLDQCTVWYQSR
jgi:hypothetical protein